MRLTDVDVTFLGRLNERCRGGTEAERRSAREVRRAWIESKLEQGVPPSEFEILCDVGRNEIRAWCAPEAPVCPLLRTYIDPVLLRRHLPGEPRQPRYSIDFITEFETKGRLLPDGRAALTTMGVEPTRDLEFVSQRSRSQQGSPTAILIMTGSDNNGDNFNAGVTRIRALFRAASRKVEEFHNITADEVSPHCRSSILHLAFHVTGSVAELAYSCDPSKPVQVEVSRLAAMLAAKPAPGLLVLAGCGSTLIATHLDNWSSAIVFWPGKVSDIDVLRYCHSLYRLLLQGEKLADAHRAGLAALGSVPEERYPRCAGNMEWILAQGCP